MSQNDYVLILMRGIPSCGKSYRALELANGNKDIICSADSFFGNTPEEYAKNWTPQKLGLAHKTCQNRVRKLMCEKSNLIIVDNTNTKMAECLPYMALADSYLYDSVIIEEPTSDWWVNQIKPFLSEREKNQAHLEKMCGFLAEKSKLTHHVPLDAIKRMMFRYELFTIDELTSHYYDTKEK